MDKQFGGRVMDNDLCDSCGATETPTHFAVCPAWKDLRRNAKDSVMEIIREYSTVWVDDIPVWWDPELGRSNRRPNGSSYLGARLKCSFLTCPPTLAL